MAPSKFKPWLPANWNYCRCELIIALEFIAACVIAQVFLDRWFAVLMSDVRQSPILVRDFVPDRVQLSLLLTLAMVCFVAYRVTSGDRARADRGMFVLGCGAVSGFFADKLKFVFGRPPPDAVVADGANAFNFLSGEAGLDCFPSSHAAMAAGIAGALSALWPAQRGMFLSLAVIVAASRLVNAHYLSDLLFGVAVGLVIVVLVQILFHNCGIPLEPRNPVKD